MMITACWHAPVRSWLGRDSRWAWGGSYPSDAWAREHCHRAFGWSGSPLFHDPSTLCPHQTQKGRRRWWTEPVRPPLQLQGAHSPSRRFCLQTQDSASISVFLLAEISVKSPRKIFIFIIWKNVFWIKVSKKMVYLILKTEALALMCAAQIVFKRDVTSRGFESIGASCSTQATPQTSVSFAVQNISAIDVLYSIHIVPQTAALYSTQDIPRIVTLYSIQNKSRTAVSYSFQNIPHTAASYATQHISRKAVSFSISWRTLNKHYTIWESSCFWMQLLYATFQPLQCVHWKQYS